MFLEVVKAKYIDGYRLKIWFNDGQVKMVDLKDSLNQPAFLPLRNLDIFKNFTIHFNTIEWPNEVDLAPEYLYDIGSKITG